MEVFLIYCIPCAIIGMFIATLITAGAKTKWGHALGFIIISLILTAVFAGGFTAEYYGEQRTWNDGRCADCGGYMEFTNATKYRGRTTYYWACEDCGHIIETVTRMRG